MKFNLVTIHFHCVEKSNLDNLPTYFFLLCSTEERTSWVSKLGWWINCFHFRVNYVWSLEVVSDEEFLCGLCKNMILHDCLYTQEYRSPTLEALPATNTRFFFLFTFLPVEKHCPGTTLPCACEKRFEEKAAFSYIKQIWDETDLPLTFSAKSSICCVWNI